MTRDDNDRQRRFHALHALHRHVIADKITSLALPRLATGLGGLDWAEVRPFVEKTLGDLPIPVYLFADSEVERLLRRPKVEVGNFVGFELQRAPLSRADRAMKRLLDVSVAATALIVLSPLMAMICSF